MCTTEQLVLNVIESDVRPALQTHGGDIEFVNFDETGGVVTVTLTGACGSCPFAQETLRSQVEAVVKKAVPEVSKVVRG